MNGASVADYYYEKNLQGDIVGIIDSDGNRIVSYEYDSWGRMAVEGNMAATIGVINPFRYRGYFYDEETGWYYLKSRYYDPEVGRFLNEDVFYYDGHGIKGYNMYGYCGNNPLNNADSFGSCYYNLNGVMSTKTQYYNLNGVMQVICENQYCSVNGTDYVLNKDNAYVKDWLNYEKNNSDGFNCIYNNSFGLCEDKSRISIYL